MERFDVIDKDGNPTGETVTCRRHSAPDSTYMDPSQKRRTHTGVVTETVEE